MLSSHLPNSFEKPPKKTVGSNLAFINTLDKSAVVVVFPWLPLTAIVFLYPLKISPKPDTIIRVVMEYKALNKPIEVKEQKILTPERNGFVAVEWGGTEIKSFNLN